MGGDLLVSGVVQATPDKLQSSYSVMKYHKEGPACVRIPYDPASSEADCEYPFDYNKKTKNPVRKLDIRYLHFTAVSSRSLPPPIKAGRFPFAQNLVKLSRSLNRFP